MSRIDLMGCILPPEQRAEAHNPATRRAERQPLPLQRTVLSEEAPAFLGPDWAQHPANRELIDAHRSTSLVDVRRELFELKAAIEELNVRSERLDLYLRWRRSHPTPRDIEEREARLRHERALARERDRLEALARAERQLKDSEERVAKNDERNAERKLARLLYMAAGWHEGEKPPSLNADEKAGEARWAVTWALWPVSAEARLKLVHRYLTSGMPEGELRALLHLTLKTLRREGAELKLRLVAERLAAMVKE
jgi:hypothetical protein